MVVIVEVPPHAIAGNDGNHGDISPLEGGLDKVGEIREPVEADGWANVVCGEYGFTIVDSADGTHTPDTPIWYPTGQLCELVKGTQMPEALLWYPAGQDWKFEMGSQVPSTFLW
jgi:hypothetical protein